MITHLSLRAYAKINLSLDVLRKRDDGYHEIRTIMQTVRLFDRIEINRKKQPGISITTNLYYLPANGNNLAARAAQLLFDEFSINDGISIDLKKTIPVAAGLAGGSSDAAAVLFGVNKMFGLGLAQEDLMSRAASLGADVPFCVARGTALSEGIGEILTPLPAPPDCRVIIAKPGINVSTRSVYEDLDLDELPPEAHPDTEGMIKGLEDHDLSEICRTMGNTLESVTLSKYPQIGELKNLLIADGADGALMSGSGPSVFGLFSDEDAAKRTYEQLRYGSASHLARQVWLTDLFNNDPRNTRKKDNRKQEAP